MGPMKSCTWINSSLMATRSIIQNAQMHTALSLQEPDVELSNAGRFEAIPYHEFHNRNMCIDASSMSFIMEGKRKKRLVFNPGDLEDAIQQMEGCDAEVSMAAYAHLIKEYGKAKDVTLARRLHDFIARSGLQRETFIGNRLIEMYRKCGHVGNAREVFDAMTCRNVVSWTSIIAIYVHYGEHKEALKLFVKMLQVGMKPDKVLFMTVLGACSSPVALEDGKKIHNLIVQSGLHLDMMVQTALIRMYGMCSSLKNARAIFEKTYEPDVTMWTVMISASSHCGHERAALEIFHQMEQKHVKPDKVIFLSVLNACASLLVLDEGKLIHAKVIISGFDSDNFVRNALMNMYGKCGSFDAVKDAFRNLTKRNVVSWSTIIAISVEHGLYKQALQLFEKMQLEGVVPNEFTFVSVIDACTKMTRVANGKIFHSLVILRELDRNVVVGNALVNMYNKFGILEDAHVAFINMPLRNMLSWTTMLTAYAQHGDADKVVKVLSQMHVLGVSPDQVTFVSILSACSHVGLIDEACNCLLFMVEDDRLWLTLEHYSCTADLLGRAGWLGELEDFILMMPLQPDIVIWISLLSACRNLHDLQRGRRTAHHILCLDAENPATYMMLSNIYAAAYKLEKMENTGGDIQGIYF